MPRSASVVGLAKRGVIPRKQFYIKLFVFNTVILREDRAGEAGASAGGGEGEGVRVQRCGESRERKQTTGKGMSQMDELVGKVIDKLADPIVDLLKKLAGPAAEEIGLTMRDVVHVYRAKRAYRLAEKIQEFCRQRGIAVRPINLKLLLPALDYASVEDDEDLHTMWANLLTNAADPSQDEVLPSFADTLKQLSKPEAQLLNAFYDSTVAWQKSAGAAEQFTVSVEELLKISEQNAHLLLSFDHFQLIIDDLQRLGLLRIDMTVSVSGTMPIIHEGRRLPAHVHHGYFIGDYARQFVEACRAPTTKCG